MLNLVRFSIESTIICLDVLHFKHSTISEIVRVSYLNLEGIKISLDNSVTNSVL